MTTADPAVLVWTFAGAADVRSCTGGGLEAAGESGDYTLPTAVVASSLNTLTLRYADTFVIGDGAWFVGTVPAGIILNGSTFAVPQGGSF